MPGIGGGHSGGGHSGGGSHGGSHGGGFGGSHGPRGGFGGGPRGGFGGPPPPRGGFGGPPPPRGPRRPHWGYGWGWGWGPRRRYYGGGGCLAPFIVMIVFVVMMFVFVTVNIFGGIFSRPSHSYPTVSESKTVMTTIEVSDITPSTRRRSPLDPKYCKPIDKYLSDEMGALPTAADEYAVIGVLKDFYLLTGVQPFLWVASELDGNKSPDYDTLEQAMYSKYTELFDDEGHLLVLYFLYPDTTYNTWYMWGDDAHEYVMDDAACEILLDHIDRNYEKNCDLEGNVDYTQMFCAAFTNAAHDIMGGITETPVTPDSNAPDSNAPVADTSAVPSPTQDAKVCRLSWSGVALIVMIACVAAGVIVFLIVRKKKEDDAEYAGMSEEDKRKEKYRKKYSGK